MATLRTLFIAVYCDNHTKHMNTLYGQNAEFQYVKAGST
jgi:hypothetical protein